MLHFLLRPLQVALGVGFAVPMAFANGTFQTVSGDVRAATSTNAPAAVAANARIVEGTTVSTGPNSRDAAGFSRSHLQPTQLSGHSRCRRRWSSRRCCILRRRRNGRYSFCLGRWPRRGRGHWRCRSHWGCRRRRCRWRWDHNGHDRNTVSAFSGEWRTAHIPDGLISR